MGIACGRTLNPTQLCSLNFDGTIINTKWLIAHGKKYRINLGIQPTYCWEWIGTMCLYHGNLALSVSDSWRPQYWRCVKKWIQIRLLDWRGTSVTRCSLDRFSASLRKWGGRTNPLRAPNWTSEPLFAEYSHYDYHVGHIFGFCNT